MSAFDGGGARSLNQMMQFGSASWLASIICLTLNGDIPSLSTSTDKFSLSRLFSQVAVFAIARFVWVCVQCSRPSFARELP
ncbi:MAG: hypothetical protein CME19_14450 [Gemmatimonadetes bacterium]|nr:hypothetical protein [Gemmatimonadota bacterium]